MSTPRYQPKVGDAITIALPDEVTRGVIERVISEEAVIASLSTYLTGAGKSHQYRKGDLVPCRFDNVGMNQRGWRAVSQREMDDAAAAHEAKQAPEKKRGKGK
jgi:hypothetical protein